jgi:hypothetical protein
MFESFWSPNGKKLGSIRSTGPSKANVYDGQGKPLGTVDRQGTFDLAKRRIANKPLPGLLIRNNLPKR